MSVDNALIGKRLLVGTTYRTHQGEFLRQVQIHGLIVEADKQGIVLERADGEGCLSLPPRVEPAESAEYTLRSTGEVVRPDYVAMWVFEDPPPEITL